MHVFLWSDSECCQIKCKDILNITKSVQCKILFTCVYALLSYYINIDEGIRAVAWFPYTWAYN
jgi:hypothetical protein